MKKRLTQSMIVILLLCMTILSSFCIDASAVSKVSLNKTSQTINVGKTYTLKMKGTTKKVTWSTSNKKIATVSSKGVVKGVKVGSCKIYAKVGGKTYTCNMKVTKPKVNTLTPSQVQAQMESALRSAGIPSSVEYAQNLWDSGSVSYYSYEELMAMANDTNASWFEFDAPKTGMDSGAITSLVSNYTGFHGFRLVYQREQGDAYIFRCYCY